MDSTIRSAAHAEPPCDEVRAALDRVLLSSRFAKATQQCQFLRFVVEETLQSREANLKEYSIGAALKGPSFDSDTDTTVRVQAANIRRKLAEHYAGPGAGEHVIIELPKPGYVPAFRYRAAVAPDDAREAPARRPLILMLAGAGLVLAIAGVMVFRSRGSAGSVQESLRLVQITQDPGWSKDPAVSRDGKLLAFSSDRAEPGASDIWIRDLDGGEPRRLTYDRTAVRTPDFSPDSRSVVYQSSRDGGGIYIVPAAGGTERRIADKGFEPRYSPDGAWIAFTRIEASGNSSVYVVPASGGRPRRVQEQTLACNCPLWTPDGKALHFAAESNGSWDWWAAPFDPSADRPVPARRSGLLAALLRHRIEDQYNQLCNRDWLDNDLLLGSKGGLLRIGMNSGDWSVQEPITQVLPAVGLERLCLARSASGKASVVYAGSQNQTRIWGAPLAGKLTESRGELLPLADEPAITGFGGSRPSLSSDGRFLVFSNAADLVSAVRLYDLKKGTKTRLDPAGAYVDRAVISRDAKAVAWRLKTAGHEAIFVAPIAEPARVRRVCDDCGQPLGWSPDRESVLYLRNADLYLLDVETGLARALFKREKFEVFQASFSPEGRRIALAVGVPGKDKIQGIIAPFDGNIGADSSWTPITEESYHLAMDWAPDGDVIYYFATRDGYRCLWAQRLDRSGLRPAGEPVAIRHFDRQRRYPLMGSWIAAARDVIAVNLTESRANLYRLDLP
jgi:Tol biopolymer transport system component